MLVNRLRAGVTLVMLVNAMSAFAQTEPAEIEAYASLRLGLDYVDASTVDDAITGRDYLSRVGVKAKLDIGSGLKGIGHIEYGLRGEDKVHFRQNEGISLRLFYAGLEGDLGRILFGSQTLIFHKYVRGAYFSDTNDTIRQGAIRDDDLLQYFTHVGSVKMAAGAQFKDQDGDSIDQYQFGAEYEIGKVKLQGAYIKDNQGELKGDLVGLRAWWSPTDKTTLSAYTHIASEDFDLYTGSFSGNVRITGGQTEGNIPGVVSCVSEARSSSGFYGRYDFGQHSLHGRYAVDACDDSGDVDSIKGEYVYAFTPSYRLWLAYEALSSSEQRKPQSSSGEDMSEVQLGLRVDF